MAVVVLLAAGFGALVFAALVMVFLVGVPKTGRWEATFCAECAGDLERPVPNGRHRPWLCPAMRRRAAARGAGWATT